VTTVLEMMRRAMIRCEKDNDPPRQWILHPRLIGRLASELPISAISVLNERHNSAYGIPIKWTTLFPNDVSMRTASGDTLIVRLRQAEPSA